MRVAVLSLTALLLGAPTFACSGAVDASSAGPPATRTAVRATTLCPGVRLDLDRVKTCTDPFRIRHGHACDAADSENVCPSADLLHGDCRCQGGTWSCQEPAPPAGYDPYPDCPDKGVSSGAACYLEGSTCLPAAAAACFTSKVPLCTCSGHSWACGEP